MPHRILHILSQRPSHTGSGTTLDAMVRHANAAGYEQHVIVGVPLDDASPQVGELPADHIHPLAFGEPPLDFPLPGMSDVMPYPSSRFSELTDEQVHAYRRRWREHLSDVIARVQPDLVHSHHVWMLSGMIRDVATRTPVATHCHGTGLRQLKQCPRFVGKVQAGCRRNDHFFALHPQQADEIARRLNIPPQRVTVVGAGYREDVFHAQAPATGSRARSNSSLVYAGKLSHAKGVPQLLDAVASLTSEWSDLHLHIAGGGAGDEADVIVRRIEQLSSHVTWHGQLSPAELADLLRSASVFVLPSFYEGLPLVVAEAIACGCRVVATDLPGTRHIAGQLGDVVQLVRPPEMESVDRPRAAALPAFCQELSAAIVRAVHREHDFDAAKLAAPFTWGEVFGCIESVWCGLLEKR